MYVIKNIKDMMTLKEFKKTRLGKYAMKVFRGQFKTDKDVANYRNEIFELTNGGNYESVYEFCLMENGAFDIDDVLEFLK